MQGCRLSQRKAKAEPLRTDSKKSTESIIRKQFKVTNALSCTQENDALGHVKHPDQKRSAASKQFSAF